MGFGPQDREAALADFFQALANAFLKGDHVWLSQVYIYPPVVFVEGDIVLERTPEETLHNLFERREVALRAGTKSIRSSIQYVGFEHVGRFPVRVTWDFISADNKLLAKNELRYFCRFDSDGRTRIEILEFIKRGLPSPKPGRRTEVH